METQWEGRVELHHIDAYEWGLVIAFKCSKPVGYIKSFSQDPLGIGKGFEMTMAVTNS